MRPGCRFTAVVLLAVFGLVACGPKSPSGPPPGGAKPPVVEVGVVTVTPGATDLISDLPGRLEALRSAVVRARVAGVLQRRLFKEGSDVKAGQLLFVIDAASYKASLDAARATLARAQANQAQAAGLLERNRPLLAAKAISAQDFANLETSLKQAEADVLSGQAAVQTATINLGYASVTAPISGRIGRALVTEGALVGQGEATSLAQIQQIDSLYVNFSQPMVQMLNLRRAVESGRYEAEKQAGAAVKLVLEDGSIYPLAGRLLFSDLNVDANTGQVQLRAQVPNPKGLLLPGMYVRVRIELAQAATAVLLPQQAVSHGPQGDSVMLVDGAGRVVPRAVKLGPVQGSQWVVLEGLSAGDKVVVDGFQKLRPNVQVKPVPWTASPSPAASTQ